MTPTGSSRVLQIHPTRRCNLACLHCYSSSGPGVSEQLPVEVLSKALADAVGEGYRELAVSGGEPLLYRPLTTLLRHARDLGMRTAVASNGMLLDARRVDRLSGLVDALAISLDGVPESHNRVRGNPKAFDAMAANLENVRRAGIPFGFIFTLTQHNVHELEPVAAFAVEQGASLLQVHPLTAEGTAVIRLLGAIPDAAELTFAFIEAARVKEEYEGRLGVHVDAVARATLVQAGDVVPHGTDGGPLSDLVSPLVIESDGRVSPLCYGFDPSFALGNVLESDLRVLASGWRTTTAPRFLALCRTVHAALTRPDGPAFVDWYSAMTAAARRYPATAVA